MTDEQHKLVREIQDLQFEIDEYTRSINKRKIILERKQQLKEMNDAHRNTNEAVENKQKEHLVSDLQSKNWYVNMREFRYPMLEVIDENTVKIEGVEYKKVEKPKPQTLFEYLNSFRMINAEGVCNIVRSWLIDHTVIETEDAEKVTFTIHKEQLQTPK
jgi:hypothetical protein